MFGPRSPHRRVAGGSLVFEVFKRTLGLAFLPARRADLGLQRLQRGEQCLGARAASVQRCRSLDRVACGAQLCRTGLQRGGAQGGLARGVAALAPGGALDRASPNFMGTLAGQSRALDIGILCDFLYSVLLLNMILGLDFLG